MSPEFDKNVFYSKRKKKQNYHGLWVPNLILSYQALYIAKLGLFWIASKNFSSWDHYISGNGTDRESEGDYEKYKNMGLWNLTISS